MLTYLEANETSSCNAGKLHNEHNMTLLLLLMAMAMLPQLISNKETSTSNQVNVPIT